MENRKLYRINSIGEYQKNALYYRKQNYKNNYPTGSWIRVKELGEPDMMIEIEVEAFISK
jgi:2-iminobutanoate/2-iminopropanoate deaminase